MNETYWRLPEDEQPQNEKEQICVLYISDAQAVVTNWGDEIAEERLHDIAAWLPIPHPIELRRDRQQPAATVSVNKAALLDLMRYANGQPRPYPQEAIAAFGQLCRDLLAAGDSPQEEVGG